MATGTACSWPWSDNSSSIGSARKTTWHHHTRQRQAASTHKQKKTTKNTSDRPLHGNISNQQHQQHQHDDGTQANHPGSTNNNSRLPSSKARSSQVKSHLRISIQPREQLVIAVHVPLAILLPSLSVLILRVHLCAVAPIVISAAGEETGGGGGVTHVLS